MGKTEASCFGKKMFYERRFFPLRRAASAVRSRESGRLMSRPEREKNA
jgi:hypothetical protein